MKDGDVCWTDAMCGSGYCRGNKLGTKKGVCGKASSGEKCGVDAHCDKGSCGRLTAKDGAKPVCCPSGKTVRVGGFDYCTDMKDGDVCWRDSMCGSGYCRGSSVIGMKKGICGKAEKDASCRIDKNCKNGACGRETAAGNAKKVCCKSGKTDRFGGFDYCTEMPNTSVCWSDAMCESGYCMGSNWFTGRKGLCLPKNDDK